MAVVKATNQDLKLLARLMRAEAEGDGKLGMLMVGNVGVNRTRVGCLDFEDIDTIRRLVFQSPGGFEATTRVFLSKGTAKRYKYCKKSRKWQEISSS